MLVATNTILKQFTRKSKLGHEHTYFRKSTTYTLRCDCCGKLFYRAKSNINPARQNNRYFHVCGNCDAKRFAQKKGTERRTIWDRPASSSDDISKL